ncbi:hypothetical protein CKY51_11425 [Xanthomonas maliensis]|nr:hypothetical protein CKY51_11425 [Xanthomonas maliensis]
MAQDARHGAIVALEPIENRGDDVPERTKKFGHVGSVLGGLVGGRLGVESKSALVGPDQTQKLGNSAGEMAGTRLAGNGPAAHYMVKIRFDNKSQVVLSKAATELKGLDVGSRVVVSGSGQDMRIAAE